MVVKFFGSKSVIDALNNGYKLLNIYCTNLNHVPPGIDKKLVQIKSKDFFNSFQDINHQFFVGEFDIVVNFFEFNQALEIINKMDKAIILILDQIEDPRNFGAILRNALAFGVDLVIYKNNHQAQLNNLVIKTSLGAIHQLKLCKVANVNQVIEKLKQVGFWIYATSLETNSINFEQVEFNQKSAIIVGNENNGISQLVLKNSDYNININTTNQIQSLNVSVATGIILQKVYSKVKQK